MNRLVKALVLSGVMFTTIAAPITEASARGRHHGGYWGGPSYYHGGGYYRHHHHHHRNRGGDAAAAGIIGLATGAIIGSAMSRPSEPRVIYEEPPRRVYRVEPSGYEPWTREWYRACSYKYRSFNAQTGTFRGYDGRDHFCTP